MSESIEKSPLYRIVNPGSIAFLGASNNFAAMGSMLLSSLQALGFEGPVYPVHPSEKQVQGLTAYRSVFDLPETPDLAVMVLPTRITAEKLEECGQKGIRHAIVVSGGFREVGGDGVRLEKRLTEVADAYGIRFLGPNCIGVANPHCKLNTTAFWYEGQGGFIGMASQSGSFITQMFDYLRRLSLGFSTAFSVGNEANVDIVDCMQYLGACPHTRVIGLYIEGIKRGRAFLETARAIVPHKPIVAYYVGGSEAGKRAGLSHTGSLAGPDRMYDGVFEQSGVIRAHSIMELFDFCWVLGGLPKARGARVVIETHSGGPGAIAADACARAGLRVPPLTAETQERLEPFIPHTGSIGNPVDITFTKEPRHFWVEIPKAIMEGDSADMLLMYFIVESEAMRRTMVHFGVSEEEVNTQTGKLIRAQCKAVRRILDTYQKPVVGYTFRSLSEEFTRGLMDMGIPVFPGAGRASRALGAMARYARIRERLLGETSRSSPPGTKKGR